MLFYAAVGRRRIRVREAQRESRRMQLQTKFKGYESVIGVWETRI